MSDPEGGSAFQGEVASTRPDSPAPWQPPSFDHLELVPGDLLRFSELVTADLDSYNESWQQAEAHKTELPYFGGLSELGGSMPEGRDFQQAYISAVMAQTRLMSDGAMALVAMVEAAAGVHASTLTADLLGGGNVVNVWDNYTEEAVDQALSPRLEDRDSGEGSGEDLTEQAREQYEEILAAEEAAGSDDFGESADSGFVSNVPHPDDAPPRDIRDDLWEELGDSDHVYVSENLEEGLYNEGLPPTGHPHHEGLNDERSD